MTPSLRDGDVILAPRRRSAPARGRIVVISMPAATGPRWHVKRIIGLPRERVALKDGLLFINGTHYSEPYLGGLPAALGPVNQSWEVGPEGLFVMGDNRAHSTDSRHFGPIPQDWVIGTLALRLWPPGQRRRDRTR